MLVAAKYRLGMILGGIGNAFCTTPCTEKICSVAREQFGDKNGGNCGAKAGQIRIYGSRNPTTMKAMII
eukprot:13731087-Ditylum_brightwellii.AAC.1